MTTIENAKSKGKLVPGGWKGIAIMFFGGGVFGALVGMLIAKSGLEIDTGMVRTLGQSGMIAFGIGALYMLTGAFLLIAVVAPIFGQNILTGPDAQDLEDARALYALQAIAALCMGGALIVLTLSGPGLWLTRTVGGVGFLALLVAGVGLWIRSFPMMDELVRAATMDSAVWTYGFLLAIGGGWAAMAHLEIVTGPTMLDWLSMFWGFSLIASYIAAARRGMMDS